MRTAISIFLAVCASLSLSAQSSWDALYLSQKHVSGVYGPGRRAAVYAEYSGEKPSTFTVTVSSNGSVVDRRCNVPIPAGKKKLVYKGRFSSPSAVKVCVALDSCPDSAASIGFVVDPDGFRPGFDEPADFMEFWRKQIAAMRELPVEAVLEPFALTGKLAVYADKVEVYEVEINMHEGRPVRAYVAWPKDAAPRSLPITIHPHGAGVRSADPRYAIEWALKGSITMDINAHGLPNGKPKSFYEEYNRGELADYRTRRIVNHEQYYFRLMYLRMQRAVDWMTTLPAWDGVRIAAMGRSQGGGQAEFIAGVDPRVGFASFEVPALTDFGGLLASHRCGWPKSVGKHAYDGADSEIYREILPYYDGVNFLRHTMAQVVMEAGLTDETCAPEAVISGFNVCPSENKVLYLAPWRPHVIGDMEKREYDNWYNTIELPRVAAAEKYMRE